MTVYYLPILLVAVSSRLLLLRSCIFPTVILSTFHCIVPVLYAVARLFFQSGLASKQVRCAGLGLERDVAYTISSSAMIRHDLAYRVPAVFMFSFLYNKSQKKKHRPDGLALSSSPDLRVFYYWRPWESPHARPTLPVVHPIKECSL